MQCCLHWDVGDVDAVLFTLGCGRCRCSAVYTGMWKMWMQCCLHWDVGDVDAVLFTLGCGRCGCSAVYNGMWEM